MMILRNIIQCQKCGDVIEMFDIHTHVVFEIDDGAADIEMSMELLRMACSQGVRDMVCTSHSWGFMEDYENNFSELKRRAAKEGLPINLYTGCEVACSKYDISRALNGIKSGLIPTMNGTEYVMLEFGTNISVDELTGYVWQIRQETGKRIIIAHVERYRNLRSSAKGIRGLLEWGCLFQINAYSLCDEQDSEIRDFARRLLAEKLVTFLGSDAHSTDHRPLNVKSGLGYVYSTCDIEYARDVCYRNAEKLLNSFYPDSNMAQKLNFASKL